LSQDIANSFSPVAGEQSKVLILGTMPGQASLQAAQYYAHPRNAFWPILLSVINRKPVSATQSHQLEYRQRIQQACSAGYALWDVLAQCHRPGSLDSKIQRASEIPNPVQTWLSDNPTVTRVCFNGKTAAALFKRHIEKKLSQDLLDRPIEFFTLPSTSPAMASLNLEQKYQAWHSALTINDA